ncbi:hypothetical protein JX266_003451 [Neoarthrinium moseri]|nr:hypothetical protein JX266_003451 [Neoarthrinium moseri]
MEDSIEKTSQSDKSASVPLSDESLKVTPPQTWTAAEERRARRKVDLSVLPLLVLGLLVFQLDRMNLASALTAGFAADIGVDQETINLGNQLMFLGIVVLEIPCNMLLQRVGPRRWMPGQVLLFGTVAALQVFIRNRAGFLASRVCLGLAEAGYIPGAMYTVSTWYCRGELARRIAFLFFGMFGGNALSPLLASGILKLDGARGVRGWQWLFLLEGLFTMMVSVMIYLLLPGSPDTPKPLGSAGLIRFSGSEQVVLQKRLENDRSENGQSVKSTRIPLKLVWKTVTHYKRWPHFVSTFCVFSTWTPLMTYTPSIIMSLGFERIAANALAAVGASLALPVVFTFAYLSDRTNRRGLCVIAAQLCYLVTLITIRSVHPHVGKWPRWVLWTVVNAFSVGYHPVHNSWVQLNCKEPRERSISICMWVMSAITGNMVGTQYFRGDDVPFYHNGLRTMIIMVSVGIFFAILQVMIYRNHNGRAAQDERKATDGEEPMIYTP